MGDRGLAQLHPHRFKFHFGESLNVRDVIENQNVALTVIENEILVGELDNLVCLNFLSFACIFVNYKLQG
jgi:hypothetical protein